VHKFVAASRIATTTAIASAFLPLTTHPITASVVLTQSALTLLLVQMIPTVVSQAARVIYVPSTLVALRSQMNNPVSACKDNAVIRPRSS
jgi:hypothetical protein